MYRAAVFDMDGVLVDNHQVHVRVWKMFCDSLGIALDEGEFRGRFFGKSNYDILTALSPKPISREECDRLAGQKEALYREIYRPDVRAVEGLIPFLEWLRGNDFQLAVATSAPPENLHFVLDALGIRGYFDLLTDASGVARAKPDPEIYLKSGRELNLEPGQCVVFEDSVSGIQSATAAGMPVVGLLTTHRRAELPDALMYITDFHDARLKPFMLSRRLVVK